MPPKPIPFQQYLEWFDTHNVVINAQKNAPGQQLATSKAAAKELEQKAAVPATANTGLLIIESHFGTHEKKNQEAFGNNDDFELLVGHVVDDVTRSAGSQGKAKGVKAEEIDAGWEVVEREGDGEFELV